MARILRGDIWWADLSPVRGHEQAGIRPVLVISNDVFNDRSGTVIAVAITSQEPAAGFPLTQEIHSARHSDGLPRRSWVKISQIRTLSVERLTTRVGQVLVEELDLVINGLDEIVGN
jgi:mRNA interferase MazF